MGATDTDHNPYARASACSKERYRQQVAFQLPRSFCGLEWEGQQWAENCVDAHQQKPVNDQRIARITPGTIATGLENRWPPLLR